MHRSLSGPCAPLISDTRLRPLRSSIGSIGKPTQPSPTPDKSAPCRAGFTVCGIAPLTSESSRSRNPRSGARSSSFKYQAGAGHLSAARYFKTFVSANLAVCKGADIKAANEAPAMIGNWADGCRLPNRADPALRCSASGTGGPLRNPPSQPSGYCSRTTSGCPRRRPPPCSLASRAGSGGSPTTARRKLRGRRL
jgi:hypothetical protein